MDTRRYCSGPHIDDHSVIPPITMYNIDSTTKRHGSVIQCILLQHLHLSSSSSWLSFVPGAALFCLVEYTHTQI
jgi:hypothetical protein